MRSNLFFPIALCGLLLTTVSCKTRVDSVFVDPGVGVYSYASQGDTLEFKALNPNAPPFYVIFDNPSPCAETYLEVTGAKPGTCKVKTKSAVVHYILSQTPPGGPLSKPHTCPYCQIVITPNPPPSASKQGGSAKGNTSSATSQSIPIPVTCSEGVVSVPKEDATNGDSFFWADPDALGTSLTITIPGGVCMGAGSGDVVLQQIQACVVDAPPPYPHSYPYRVQMNGVSGCGNAITGTLNVEAPNSTTTAK